MPGVNMFGGGQAPPPKTQPQVDPQSAPATPPKGTNMFGAPQSQTPAQDNSFQLPDVAGTTPNANKPLPEGAVGMDASGNPVFKDNLAGIAKKWMYNFTKDVKDVTPQDWQNLKSRWQTTIDQAQASGTIRQGQLTPEQAQISQDQLKLVGETVSKAFQAGQSGQGWSPLAPVLKATSASVTAIGDLFSLPAKKMEQGLGAVQGFSDAAQQVDSVLPRLDQNDFTKGIENTPLGLAYDFTRLALSPSDNKWEQVKKGVNEGWQSGRILYSQVFDQTLKEKFLNDYRYGEDPQLIAEKMQNPLAEMAGQLILDPLNIVGGFLKAAKSGKELETALEATKASGLLKTEEGAKALDLISKAQDEGSAAEAFKTLVGAQQKAVNDVQTGSKLLNVTYDANSLTTSSRQNALIGKGKELLGNMALLLKQSGMSYDGVAEAIYRGVQSVAKDENVMREGLSGLAKLPNAHMWLADDYIETFTMMHKIMADENGVLNGSKLVDLMKAGNPAEFADAAKKIMQAAALTEFPDVGELAKAAEQAKQAAQGAGEITARTAELAKRYEALPNHVKYLDKINTTLATYIKNPINKMLSPLYFNLQGGVAAKNVLANNELIFLDKGIGAWFKDGEYLSKEKNINFLKDTFGELPSASHGFTSLVSASTDAKPLLFGKWMEAGEEEGAARIVATSVRDTFDNMIPKALSAHFEQAVKDGLMTQKQVDKFTKLAVRNGGNLEKTLNEFRDFYKVGAVEQWRNLDFVTDFQKQALDKMGYWQEIEDLAHNGAASQADVEAAFNKITASIDTRAEMATKDVIGLSPDHGGAPVWGDLMKAVDEGHLNPNDQQVFTAIMESAEQTRLEYQKLLDDVALKASTSLSQEGRVQEAQHIGQEMNRVRDVLRQAGPETAKDAQAITKDAWRWSDAIKAEKKPTPEFLQSVWKKAGLAGEPPLDLNKQSLLKTLWQERFKKVTNVWNSSFDAVVGESETILKQMDGIVDTNELQQMAAKTRNISEQAQALRSATYEKGALRIRPTQDIAYVAKQYGVKTEEILNTINNKLPEGAQAFTKIEDVPTKDVLDVLEQVRQEKGLPELKGIAVPPPHPIGTNPSFPRAWNESSKGAKYTLQQIKNGILENWGKADDARQFNPAMEAALKNAVAGATPKMGEIKAAALKIATEQRNFTLLNYGERTYADVAKSYIMPYHFFYTRSYKNWITRIATHPEIVAGYAKYKTALEGINKDLPDWYKQQLNINPLADNPNMAGKKLLGIPLDHPLYINLEATLNPLYGLTGTDYSDPAKRVDWATATLDDMGKFGPTVWAPIQMAMAAKLYHDGETDAASRWGSRLIPETAQIKAITAVTAPFFKQQGGALANWFGHPLELDPAVQFFSGGIEATDRGRMGYSAAELIKSGQYTAEEVQQAFQQQSGEIWDKAYQMAVQSRTASSLSSYFLGVGFKPRSTNDVMVEDMYTKLNKLYAMSDMMSGDQFKTAQEQLRAMYPDGLVDTVLLAKKGGDQRDSAYAYNVLGRMPPGEMSDVFKAIGISSQDVSKFYDSKGFTDPKVKFTSTEKSRFMDAIIDLGTMLKIPDSATRTEWNTARSLYSDNLEQIAAQVGMPYEKDARGKITGRGVWDEISHYYDLKDDDKQAADAFKQAHPEIQMALQLKGESIANSPTLSAYYGGIDNIEAYISGNTRQKLSDKYGADIYKAQTDYFNASNPKAFLAAHPELKRFWADKKVLDAQGEQMFMQLASKLPNAKPAQFQPGFTPQSGVQQTMYDALQPKNAVAQWDEISQNMPPWLQNEIAAHVQGGAQLSKRAQKEVDFLASSGNYYNSADYLRTVSVSLQQYMQGGQQQTAQQPQTVGAGVNMFGQ